MEFFSTDLLSDLEMENLNNPNPGCEVNSPSHSVDDEFILSSFFQENDSSCVSLNMEGTPIEEQQLETNNGNSLSTENMMIVHYFPNSSHVIGQSDPSSTQSQQILDENLLNFLETSTDDDNLSDSLEGSKGTKRVPAKAREPSQAQNRVMAERKRRERLNEKFISLSTLIPGLSKADKGSVLGEAAKYIKQLQDRVQELEAELKVANEESAVHSMKRSRLCDDGSSSSNEDSHRKFKKQSVLPKIEARILNEKVVVRLRCEKRDGVLDKVSSQLKALHLNVISCTVIPFREEDTLDLTIVAQMAGNCCMTANKLKSAILSFT